MTTAPDLLRVAVALLTEVSQPKPDEAQLRALVNDIPAGQHGLLALAVAIAAAVVAPPNVERRLQLLGLAYALIDDIDGGQHHD